MAHIMIQPTRLREQAERLRSRVMHADDACGKCDDTRDAIDLLEQAANDIEAAQRRIDKVTEVAVWHETEAARLRGWEQWQGKCEGRTVNIHNHESAAKQIRAALK